MSYDMGAIMYFDIASLAGGFLAGVVITMCVWTLLTIWRSKK